MSSSEIAHGSRLNVAHALSDGELVRYATQVCPLPDLRIEKRLGQGGRCIAFLGDYQGRKVAAKFYSPATVARNRRRYNISIAGFENDRNRRFYEHPGLRPFVAEPIACCESKGVGVELFVQELLSEPTLHQLHLQGHKFDEGFFQHLDLICELSRALGLCDLDLNPRNICVRSGEDGERPMLFDFNMVPRHERKTNPLVSLLYWTRLRKPEYRDVRRLQTLRENHRVAA